MGGDVSNLTIKDIAVMCNVAVSTVSRALNNQPDINKVTRKRILKVCKETGFVLNNSARNLKRTYANSIAIIVKGLQNVFFTDIIKVLEMACIDRSYTTVLRHVDAKEDELDIARSLIIEHNLSGIIFLGGNADHPREKLEAIKKPAVFCTYNVTQIDGLDNYSCVCVDDVAQSMSIVSHLLDLGHREIAIITDKKGDLNIGGLRTEGYLQAYKNHGLSPDKSLLFYMDDTLDRYTMENGYAMAKRVFESGCKPTAIYAISDLLAIGVCRAVTERGMSIPQDMSIAGFDGIPFTKFYNPSLTTIQQPIEKIGITATDILFDKLEGVETPAYAFLDGHLIKGGSTTAFK